MRDERAREEIRRNLEEAGRAAVTQAERMDAIDHGEPDPNPGQDGAFVGDLERDLRKRGELKARRPCPASSPPVARSYPGEAR